MNKKLLLVAMLAIALLLGAKVVPALAEGEIETSLAADRQELAVGDPLQLTLSVKHPSGHQVIIPSLDQAWGPFEVRGQSAPLTMDNADGSQTTTQNIEVTLFDLGEFATPELSVTLSDGQGNIVEESVPSVSLAVLPTLAEEDAELRDIKPQAGLNVAPLWPRIAGGLLLAAALATLGWWYYRRRQGKPFGPMAPVDNRPPWQVALDELDRIAGLGLLEQGTYKEYYTLTTDCLRTYLEVQFDLRAFDRTTSELKAVLTRSQLEAEPSRGILDLFREADLVKFAKFTPNVTAAHRAIDEARRLVEATRPKPELESMLAGDDTSAPQPADPRRGGLAGTAAVEA
jgi:hypothetical protein